MYFYQERQGEDAGGYARGGDVRFNRRTPKRWVQWERGSTKMEPDEQAIAEG